MPLIVRLEGRQLIQWPKLYSCIGSRNERRTKDIVVTKAKPKKGLTLQHLMCWYMITEWETTSWLLAFPWKWRRLLKVKQNRSHDWFWEDRSTISTKTYTTQNTQTFWNVSLQNKSSIQTAASLCRAVVEAKSTRFFTRHDGIEETFSCSKKFVLLKRGDKVGGDVRIISKIWKGADINGARRVAVS